MSVVSVNKSMREANIWDSKRSSAYKRSASTLSAMILRNNVKKTGPPPPMKSNNPVSQRSRRFDFG